MTRILYWRQFFVPAYLAHGFWLGTGTVIPSDVPEQLNAFVDNEYLWAAFRAGIIGLVLLLSLLVAIAAAGASLRASRQPFRRALGATAFTSVLALATLGLTSEYLTFAGVSQQFWMIVGLLAVAVSPRPMQVRAAVLPPPRPLAERAQLGPARISQPREPVCWRLSEKGILRCWVTRRSSSLASRRPACSASSSRLRRHDCWHRWTSVA